MENEIKSIKELKKELATLTIERNKASNYYTELLTIGEIAEVRKNLLDTCKQLGKQPTNLGSTIEKLNEDLEELKEVKQRAHRLGNSRNEQMIMQPIAQVRTSLLAFKTSSKKGISKSETKEHIKELQADHANLDSTISIYKKQGLPDTTQWGKSNKKVSLTGILQNVDKALKDFQNAAQKHEANNTVPKIIHLPEQVAVTLAHA